MPTTGISRTVGDVIFLFPEQHKGTAHSAADTNGEDPIDVELFAGGRIDLSWQRGAARVSFAAYNWNEAASTAKEEALDLWDKWRDNRTGLRREFDALPDYEGHSGKQIGNVILRVTADGHVFARSLTDTAGTKTGKTLVYKEGQIVIEDEGVIFTDWAEAVDRLAQKYDAYEAGVAKLAEVEASFDQLPRA